jgi:hypothetical protein
MVVQTPMQFSIRGLLVLTTVAAVLLGSFVWRRNVAAEQERAIADAWQRIHDMGGHFTVGLVDGDYLVDLPRCPVGDEEFVVLANHFAKFPGPWLDQTHDFSLALNGTKITDASVQALSGLDVRSLDLSNTAVTDASVVYLERLRLWRLDIRGTAITEVGVARLKEHLPPYCTLLH